MLPKPNISLDDFLSDAKLNDIEVVDSPPRQVLLRSTGEVEVLKPLAYWEAPKTERLYIEAAPEPAATSRFTWLHGSMIAGGALVLLGLTLAGAVIFSTRETAPQQQAVASDAAPELAPAEQTSSSMPTTEPEPQPAEPEPQTSIASTESSVEEIVEEPSRHITADSNTRSGKRPSVAPPVRNSARSTAQSRTRPAERNSTTFVPSKTVIYVENGQVKQRVEPQSGQKRKQ